MPNELLIDVSEYEAPQPFEEVIKLVVNINDGEYIRMLHRKQPLPLYQLLNERGFAYICNKKNTKSLGDSLNQWEIIIWNKSDTSVNDYCLKSFSHS